MKNTSHFFDKPSIRQLLFWVFVFLFYAGTSNWGYYTGGGKEIVETFLIKTSLQFLTAYVCIQVLIPIFLNKKRYGLLIFSLLLLLAFMFSLFTLARMYYLEPTYPSSYEFFFKTKPDLSFLGRLSLFQNFINKALLFLYPAILLIAIKFYKEQQRLLKLNEQKKKAELAALKHQLNPHFLFNTLNNLYALAIKKSDETPKVIEKLSDILDYLLYRCNDEFVSLQKEIGLIENYLTLEKLRYGKRVVVSFEKSINEDVKIAPLLLLTFIENAFKHGVSQALKESHISISITLKNEQIIFFIQNTKPFKTASNKNKKQVIGLKNIKKQLKLLYPKTHHLDIKEEENYYTVTLKLVAK